MKEHRRIKSAIERADTRFNSTKRHRQLRSTFTADCERVNGHPVTEAEQQIIDDVVMLSLYLEEYGRQAALGNFDHAEEVRRLSGLKSRHLRRLNLVNDLPRAEPVMRRSQTARAFMESVERKQAADDAPDEMELYVKGRQARTERLARRIGVDVVLIDRGLIDEDAARAAWKSGDKATLRRLISKAKAAWATRDAPIVASDDDANPVLPKPHRNGSPIRRVQA